MDKPEPIEMRIEMEKGTRRAVLVLNKYAEDAYTIAAIERSGLPSLSDDDNTYRDVPKAVDAGKKLWHGTLPD